MRFLYFTIQFLPYWAIPTALILFEVGLGLRRRGNDHWFNRLAMVAGALMVLVICFFVFRWSHTAFPFLRDRIFHRT